MKIKSPFGIAAVVVVGVPVLWFALGTFGILVIKSPIPQKTGVSFTIENDELVISGTSGHRGSCPPPVVKGCIRVSKWRRAHIRFELEDMDGWIFSEMQLVAEAAGNAKLDFGAQAGFTQDMIDDFYVKINSTKVYPDTNGVIDLSGMTNGDKFKLINRNDFKQTYSYQVKACDTTSDPVECKKSDPMIVNEG